MAAAYVIFFQFWIPALLRDVGSFFPSSRNGNTHPFNINLSSERGNIWLRDFIRNMITQRERSFLKKISQKALSLTVAVSQRPPALNSLHREIALHFLQATL
jgi:hypothetical protein